MITGLVRNLWAGCRLSLFVPVRAWDFRISLAQAFLLLFVSFALNFTYDFVNSRPDNHFNVYGLSYQATLYLLFLFSILIIAGLKRNYVPVLKLVVMILSISPTTFVVYTLLLLSLARQDLVPQQKGSWFLFLAYLLWYLAVVARALNRTYKSPLRQAALYLAIYIVFNVLPYFYLPNSPLWYTQHPATEKQSRPAFAKLEDVFYAQRELIEKNSKRLLQQRPGITDLYFLGFGAYADEDVFMNEARLARRLLDERFDTKGRSMLLVNNEKTLSDLPLANSHNLKITLRQIGQRMDPEEDVLFLFLTSHGIEGKGLNVSLGPYDLNILTPKVLKQALGEAGIKWRVIVISACYSGGFIEILKDRYSLIITAADKDRSSFGCGHDGDFTYFGNAYFGRRLKQEYSFIRAFEKARVDIERRERGEGRIPSKPQIETGEEILTVLQRLMERLKESGGGPDTLALDDAYAILEQRSAFSVVAPHTGYFDSPILLPFKPSSLRTK
ncbi:MAG: C13 family peptidase [Gammaproteobacteria bacterium]